MPRDREKAVNQEIPGVPQVSKVASKPSSEITPLPGAPSADLNEAAPYNAGPGPRSPARNVTFDEAANTTQVLEEPYEQEEVPEPTGPPKSALKPVAKQSSPFPDSMDVPIKLIVAIAVCFVTLQFIAPHIGGARLSNPYIRNFIISVLVSVAGLGAQQVVASKSH